MTEAFSVTKVEAGGDVTAPPRAYHSSTLVAHGSKIVVFGGFDGSTRLNDLFVYDILTSTWLEPEDNKELRPSPRTYHTATLKDDELMIFGGYGGPEKYPKHLADLHVLNINSWQWTNYVESDAFTGAPRYFHSATIFEENKLFVFGGLGADEYLEDTHRFLLGTMTWKDIGQQVKGKAPSRRYGHAAGKLGDNKLYVHGGFNGEPLKDMFCLDTFTLSWDEIDLGTGDMVPAPRYGHSLTAFGPNNAGGLVLFGGYDGRNRMSDMFLWPGEGDDKSDTEMDIVDSGDAGAAGEDRKDVEDDANKFKRIIPKRKPHPRLAFHGASGSDKAIWIYGGYDGAMVNGDIFKVSVPATEVGDADETELRAQRRAFSERIHDMDDVVKFKHKEITEAWADMSTSLASSQAEHAVVDGRVTELETGSAVLKEDMTRLESQITTVIEQSSSTAIAQDIRSLSTKVDESKEHESKLHMMLQMIQSQFNTIQEKNDELIERVADLEREKEAIRSQNRALGQQVSGLSAELSRTNAQVETLRMKEQ